MILFTPNWERLDEGVQLPTKRVKENIGFSGFLSRSKFITEVEILSVISNYLKVNSMYSMFYGTNQGITFSKKL